MNILAGGIEASLNDIDGLRIGACVLVEVHTTDTARIVALAEPSRSAADLEGLARTIMDRAAARGIAADSA
jgi:hypothetical protein